MPFIMMIGIPCSGKTTRTNELKTYFETKHNVKVNVVGDDNEDIDKNKVYADPKQEKEVRGTLKSAIQRLINKEDVLILDSLNYIKGFRYELFCVAKSCQTPQCVVECTVSRDTASEWNKTRSEGDQYNQPIFDELVMRYEAPESRNRWDSPLFIVHADDSLPYDAIYDALYKQKAPKPNMSTQSQPLSSTNFLHELDKITQAGVAMIVEEQKSCVPGDLIVLPGATDKIIYQRHQSLAELQRLRRQFITMSKMRPVEDKLRLSNMFVQFLNTSLR